MEALLRKLGFTPTLDAVAWLSKWSTKLAALQLAFGAALGAWLTFDDGMKASFPGWVPTLLGAGVMLTGFLQALAPNIAQKKVTDKVVEKTGIVPPTAPPQDPPS